MDYTFEKKLGFTDRDLKYIKPDAPPFFKANGHNFCTKKGKPVLVPDQFSGRNTHPLSEGTEAIRITDEKQVII